MTLKVVPPKSVGRYALLIEYSNDRPAFFKTYNDLSSAKNTFHAKRYGLKKAYVLEYVEGDWYALHTVSPDDEHVPWQKEVSGGGWSRSYTYWRGKPMTRDEYANWRVAVERERLEELYRKEAKTFTQAYN